MKRALLRNLDISLGFFEVEIYYGGFRVGRSLSSNFVVEKEYVSRLHFILTIEEGKWVLQNKSQNGTFVNEKMLTNNSKIELKHRDKIGFLTKEFSLEFRLCNVNDEGSVLNTSDEELSRIPESEFSF